MSSEAAPIAVPRARRNVRRFVVAFIVACIIHLPLTPAMPLLRLARTAANVRDDDKSWDYDVPPVSSAPMEIDLTAPPPPPKDKDAFTMPKAALDGKPQKSEVRFADGSSPEPPKPTDAPEEVAEEAAFPKKQTPDESEKAKPDAPNAGDKKPMGLAGDLAKAVVGKPNVTLAMWMPQVRDHVLAKSVDDLFACSPEWRTFLDAGVVPMADLDGMIITGPQITDVTKSTVAVQHHLHSERVTALFDALVKKSGAAGKFLSPDVAQILVRKRLRVLFPHASRMVFLAPTSGWEPIHDQRAPLGMPAANGRAFSLTLQKPSKVLSKLGVAIPSRLLELRVDVFLDADGGGDIELDFDDVSEDAAEVDAVKLETALGQAFGDMSLVADAATLIAGGKHLTLPAPHFQAVEKSITGTIHIAPADAAGVLGLTGKLVCPHPKSAPHPGGASAAPVASHGLPQKILLDADAPLLASLHSTIALSGSTAAKIRMTLPSGKFGMVAVMSTVPPRGAIGPGMVVSESTLPPWVGSPA